MHLAFYEHSRANIHIISGSRGVVSENGLQLIQKPHGSQSPDPAWPEPVGGSSQEQSLHPCSPSSEDAGE